MKAKIITECIHKMQQTLSATEIAEIENGAVHVLKFKNVPMVELTDGVAITVGMFKHDLPELMFFYGPSPSTSELLSNEDLQTIDKEIDHVISVVRNFKQLPDKGRFIAGLGVNNYARMDVTVRKDCEAYVENLVKRYLFSTVALQGRVDIDVCEILRIRIDNSTKPTVN